ncbi:MAG: hypothetical protein HeimC3_47750 [Candidatus Heimdallarchaeota archaeon LC_3]|nr:MAG: hypothetical protein HeimC3_47750 [Candidatus Heimdallarchaeota archaeon LC_3]
MDFLGDWKEFFLQGLVGMGLVGFNATKFFLKGLESNNISIDYAEFFPNVAIIENGRIENQCARIYRAHHDLRSFHALLGPQPRSDELTSLFIQKFVNDFRHIHEESPIDLYISFGAFITEILPSSSKFLSEGRTDFTTIADQIINQELNKKRKLYIATCGSLDFEEFSLSVQHPDDEIVREPQGFISGLNGVLPAIIGERFNIPTVTIMVETSSAEKYKFNGAVSQLLGLLASRKGLNFLDNYFDLKMQLDSYLNPVIEEITPAARQELVASLERGEDSKPDSSPDSTFI